MIPDLARTEGGYASYRLATDMAVDQAVYNVKRSKSAKSATLAEGITVTVCDSFDTLH